MEKHSVKKSVQHFFHEEISGWTGKEIAWLIIASAAIIVVSLVLGDSVLGICTAISGIICIVLTGKGKISAFIFGAINVILYSIVALQATFYAGAFGKLFIDLPLEIIGIIVWAKHWNSRTHEVSKRHMRNRTRILTLIAIVVFSFIVFLILSQTADAMPLIDSITAVATIIGMIVAIGMFAEQWWIWIGVNALTILLWIQNLLAGNSNIATLILWVVYLVNSIIMCIKWEKEVRATSH